MSSCAFLTMCSMDGPAADDALAIESLRELGWSVSCLPWRQTSIPWRLFDVVVVRSTWDYTNAPAEYAETLAAIGQATRLENAFAVICWNMDKHYLADLSDHGVRIVPTTFARGIDLDTLKRSCAEFGADEVVVKPAIGASAVDTFRILRSEVGEHAHRLAVTFKDRDLLVQPFLCEIELDGELSVFFFDGEYSHAIRKTPRPGDFRVQEEHGGTTTTIAPDASLVAWASSVLDQVPATEHPLYARVDVVQSAGDYCLMELELIEPSLYFHADPDAACRFARALTSRVT